MHRLTPDQFDAFLRRFHHGRDGSLRSVGITMGRGGVAAVTFTLVLPDADRGDAETEVRLEVGEVTELRLQVRPTEDPQALAEGIHIESFQDVYFVDLQPWTDRPSGVHDFRVSSCYAAGVTLRWEEGGAG
jgi:hypothetical protein